MLGETDQALEMHNRYAQFQLGDKVCFTPGTPSNLDGWEKLDRTLHLKPFLELLVKEMELKIKRELTVRSIEVAKANWLGSEELIGITISTKDLITDINKYNPDDNRSKNYLAYTDRLVELKLVPTHMGVVVLDAAVDWLEAIDASWETSENRLFRIRKLVERHLNFCSVSTIGVTIHDGKTHYKHTNIRYNVEVGSFNITTRLSIRPPIIQGSIVSEWNNTEGIYSIHKGEIIEMISHEDASLIDSFREAQIRYFNEFIKIAQ